MKGRSIWERRHHSDSPKSLVFLTFGCSKTLSERPHEVAPVQSDLTKSLRSRATLSQRHLEVARVCDVLEREKWAGSNVPRATPSGRSTAGSGKYYSP